MKTLFTMFLLFCATPSFAQFESLLGGSWHFSGFGGPQFRVSKLNGESAILTGGYGGVLINKQFVFGGGGFGLNNEIEAPADFQNPGDDTRYFRLGYGGLYVEYIHNPDRLFHWTAGALIGAGGVDFATDISDWDVDGGKSFFVFEPNAGLEMNITSWFRINAHGSYRYIAGLDMDGLTSEDLTDYSVGVALKFGWFE